LDSIAQSVKRRLFWIVARSGLALYRTFPVFGSLRASIAIIRHGETVLAIERNDGRGFSLPGGIVGSRESGEEALHREVREETGLRVIRHELLSFYHSSDDVPCDISVYEVQAEGELRSSWEGSPRWVTLAELEPRILKSQRPVLKLLAGESAEEGQN